MNDTKLSINLSGENRAVLEKIKLTRNIGFGKSINILIGLFCRIPDSVRYELLDFCKNQISNLYEKIEDTEDFEFQELSNKISIYSDLATFFNSGKKISLNKLKCKKEMSKILMNDRYLIYKKNQCIFLNEEEANRCKHASVIEVKHVSFKVPHFVYFSNKTIKDYNEYNIKKIEKLCCEKWPQFKKIIDQAVDPIYDSDSPDIILNKKEYLESPIISHFQIYEDSKNLYNYNPPLGLIILDEEN